MPTSSANAGRSDGFDQALRLDGRPAEPVLAVDSPESGSKHCGLMPLNGWGFVPDKDAPEGVVEVSVDGQEWVSLHERYHVAGVPSEKQWARRGGFLGAVNTFRLNNGQATMHYRLKDRAGTVVRTCAIPVEIKNTAPLSQVTRALVLEYPLTQTIIPGLVDSSHFPLDRGGQAAWFEKPDAEARVADVIARHGLAPHLADQLRLFVRSGFIVLEDFVPPAWCDQINNDLQALLDRGILEYKSRGQRVEHLFEHSKAAFDLWTHPEILKILSALFDDVALPCQTLNFIHGSQQDVHQDTIHLTPFPQGLMCGVWVALEDIHPDSGPLVVYPGSHRLPRLYTATLGMRKVRDGDWSEHPEKFTPRLRKLINDARLQPMVYTPKKGAVLIWHENLAHGGTPRNVDTMTRKSIVSHYFAQSCLAFYDSSGSVAYKRLDLGKEAGCEPTSAATKRRFLPGQWWTKCLALLSKTGVKESRAASF